MSDPLQKQESLIESVMIVNSNHAPISPMSTNFQTWKDITVVRIKTYNSYYDLV